MAKRPDLAERNRANATHRQCGTKTYAVWRSMKQRCHCETHNAYPDYGGRGITVCDRWLHSFEAFIADMGEAPEGMTLDRINNDKGYHKDNCRWATMKEQSRNRRSNIILEYEGDSGPISYWAEKMGIERKTLQYRIRNGWEIERALTTPSLIPRKKKEE